MSLASTDAPNSTLANPWDFTASAMTSTRPCGNGASRLASSAMNTRAAP